MRTAERTTLKVMEQGSRGAEEQGSGGAEVMTFSRMVMTVAEVEAVLVMDCRDI